VNDEANRDAARVALLTPVGRGAVAVVAVEGPAAVATVEPFFVAANQKPLSQQPLGRIVFGRWRDRQGEELIVCRRSAEQLEVHCHGGTWAAKQIVEQLAQSGCRSVDWQEWIVETSDDVVQAEAQQTLSETLTLQAAAIVLDQYHGALSREVEAILAQLNDGCSAAVEARLDRLLALSEVGLHLSAPWRVVVAGRPNVGKSSLINALIGYQRAIVFDQPGTTRDVVSATTAVQGWPITLSDTAGLHSSNDELELAGIALAREQLAGADLVLWVVDATCLGEDCSATELAGRECKQVDLVLEDASTLTVVNKSDLVPAAEQGDDFALATSALTGAGIGELIRAIAQRFVPQPPATGQAVPFTRRQADLVVSALAACRRNDRATVSTALEEILPAVKR